MFVVFNRVFNGLVSRKKECACMCLCAERWLKKIPHLKFNSSPMKFDLPKRMVVFQQSFFRVAVWNIVNFHTYSGKWSNLTNIFQMGWNHQLDHFSGSMFNFGSAMVFSVNGDTWTFRRATVTSCLLRVFAWRPTKKNTHISRRFKRFVYFHPYLGRSANLTNIFQMGCSH